MYSSTGLPCSSDPPVYSQSRSLRSSTQSFLSVPLHNIDIAARRFSVAAPRLWNSLPLSCWTAPSVNIFKNRLNRLKTLCVCDSDIVALASVLWRVINLLIDCGKLHARTLLNLVTVTLFWSIDVECRELRVLKRTVHWTTTIYDHLFLSYNRHSVIYWHCDLGRLVLLSFYVVVLWDSITVRYRRVIKR